MYAKLITADIEREKNQINRIEKRFMDWSAFVLNNEIKNLEYVNNFLYIYNLFHQKVTIFEYN